MSDRRDDAKSVDLLRKGAEQGNIFAQFNLGVAYAKGTGVKRDYVEAYKWLYLSATRGYDDAPEICEALQKKIGTDDIARARMLGRQWQDAFDRKMKRQT